jgi:hypothetical protein
MSVLESKRTYKSLKSKGFVDSINRSKDHRWVDFFHNNKYVLSTKVSHGTKDIDKHLIKQMAFQCKLDKNDFIDLIKCPLSKEEYIQILDQKGFLD